MSARILACALAVMFVLPLPSAAEEAAAAPSGDVQASARQINRGDQWQRTGRDVLAGFRNMYHATVLRTGDGPYPFRMWFFGWAADDCNTGYGGCDAIFFARGKSLDDWEVYCGEDCWDAEEHPSKWVPVLVPQGVLYDGWHNGDPSVVFHEEHYYMAYSATGPNKDGLRFGMPGDLDGDLYCVMGAVSEDGIHWGRSTKPLLMYEPEIGGSPGENGAFVHGMYHRPSLLFDGGRWRLWFDYWTGKSVAMGYADGKLEGRTGRAAFLAGQFTVLRAGDNPLLPEWPNPAVIKVGKKYYSFADPSGYGEGWPGRQLAEAESDDGLTWRILGWIPPDPDTPACHVPAPALLKEDGKDRIVLYYACQKGGDPYDYRYNRIRYMSREVGE